MAGLKIDQSLIQTRKVVTKYAQPVRLDYRRFGSSRKHISEFPCFQEAELKLPKLHDLLMEGKSDLLKDDNVPMIGWKTESPFINEDSLNEIQMSAKKLASAIDIFWSCGIGGSYLGIRAIIEGVRGSLDFFNLLSKEERNGTPQILFIGHNLDSDYMKNVLSIMQGKKVGGNVISKSGGTVEPAIAFAIIEAAMKNSYSEKEVAERIIAITDANKGALRSVALKNGYQTFNVPGNVGGRFSVTSPVGLFSLAVAGVDINEFIAGARYAEEEIRNRPFWKNISMLRAAMRYAAHKDMRKDIEVASTSVYTLRSLTYWMQQLGPESEGKNLEGIWISPEYYTEMAHANGQMIQMGKRNMIETFISVIDFDTDIIIPGKGTPVDYLDGKGMNFANSAFTDGLNNAHFQGSVPTMSYILPNKSAFTLGAFVQFEMNAIALSALLLGQKPFIQPGVQAYKKIADAKSGKPGTEEDLKKNDQIEAGLNPKFIVN